MNKYEICYNLTYKGSDELVQETVRGDNLYIDAINKVLIIDHTTIAPLKFIKQIKFLARGCYQVINFPY